ncbi:MAG: undecaprenyl-diphosphate phosphatase, partial [Flavobacteriales bacterium]
DRAAGPHPPAARSRVIRFLAAFITGIFACKWMIALVKKSQLKYFSFYCIVVGVIVILYAF